MDPMFINRVREVAAGWVSGVPRAGGRIGPTFSGFPPAARQQLRN